MARKKQKTHQSLPTLPERRVSQGWGGWWSDRSSDRLRIRELERQLEDVYEAVRANNRLYDSIWLDENRDFWFSHICLEQKVETKLDGWKVLPSGRLTPSIHCLRCGAHFNAQILVSISYTESSAAWFKVRDTTPTLMRGDVGGESNRSPGSPDTRRDGDVRVERDSGREGEGKE